MTRLRPIALGVVTAAVVAVAAVLLLRSGPQPPATGAARLVPGDALGFVDFSTDRDRDAVRRANLMVERFPALRGTRGALLDRLTAIGPGVSYRRDVRPWVGPEAAVALLDAPGATSTPLAVISVADRARADAFLARSAQPPQVSSYQGVRVADYGGVSTAFAGGYLIAGPPEGVRSALDARAGRTEPLARTSTFRRAVAGLPDDRALTAYLSDQGVGRLLAGQTGVLGAAGSLLLRPGLTGAAISMGAGEDRLRLRVRQVLDPARTGKGAPAMFDPELAEAVPDDAVAYFGLPGLDRGSGRLLGAVAGGAAPGLGALADRTEAEARRSGLQLESRLGPLLRGEVAVWLEAGRPDPVLTLIARTRDDEATRRALADLQEPIIRALTPAGAPAANVPRFRARQVGGVDAFELALGPRTALAYAVFDRKLVVSTSTRGIEGVRRPSGALTDAPAFRDTLDGRPSRVASLLFLDFGKLLALLGGGSGLSRSPAYSAVISDLHRLRALGAATTGGRRDATTDLTLLIP